MSRAWGEPRGGRAPWCMIAEAAALVLLQLIMLGQAFASLVRALV